ncbi:NUDIX domain-containing protein [Flavobacteriaceae bacterium Ap0902]|nr:NUDIX domain-containing protein [Flavobacteriaceae bacterium Ap0902]
MTVNRKLLHVSIDCVIFGFDDNQLQVLLIEQEKITKSHIPMHALPGDHVIEGEGLDEAAARVLKELTGVEGVYLKQFKAFGNPDRIKDPKDKIWLSHVRKNPEAHVITIGYYSLVKMNEISTMPSSFAKSAYWVNIHNIPPLAFDHNEIFEAGLNELKKDTETNHISIELLPKKFTLSQLQELYETILEKEIDKRNFRKNMKKNNCLVPLNEKQKGVRHKPAQLFTFKLDE